MSDENIYQVIAVGDIFLENAPSSELNALLSKNNSAMDEIWKNASEEQSEILSNGTLSHFLDVRQEGSNLLVRSSFVQFKHYIAHRERPDLGMNIKPIGVSGITLVQGVDNEYAVVAKRSTQVMQYPGLLELIPSGGIGQECLQDSGQIDYQSQLLSEFFEETGLAKDCVTNIVGFALVLDTTNQVYDICCWLTIQVSQELISQQWKSMEYEGVPCFVAVNDLKEWSALNRSRIVPTSRALIDAYHECFLIC